jgi:hypothetical protein
MRAGPYWADSGLCLPPEALDLLGGDRAGSGVATSAVSNFVPKQLYSADHNALSNCLELELAI